FRNDNDVLSFPKAYLAERRRFRQIGRFRVSTRSGDRYLSRSVLDGHPVNDRAYLLMELRRVFRRFEVEPVPVSGIMRVSDIRKVLPCEIQQIDLRAVNPLQPL